MRYPGLLVAFGVDPEAYDASNGYIVSEQGKPPDYVLEVASESTGSADVGEKREYYAGLGIEEYWRFDHTLSANGTGTAGRRTVGGRRGRVGRNCRVAGWPVVGLQPCAEPASALGGM